MNPMTFVNFLVYGVTSLQQWKDVCRMLDLDLTGQTSASFSMRNIYERMLLPFECHLESIHGTISGPDEGNPYHNDNVQANGAEEAVGGDEHSGDDNPVPAGDGNGAGDLSTEPAAATSSTPVGPSATDLNGGDITPAPKLSEAAGAPTEQESDAAVEPHTLATPASDALDGAVQAAGEGRDVGEVVEAVPPMADDRAQDQRETSTASVKVRASSYQHSLWDVCFEDPFPLCLYRCFVLRRVRYTCACFANDETPHNFQLR